MEKEQLISEISCGLMYSHYKQGGRYVVIDHDALERDDDGYWHRAIIYQSLNEHDYEKRYVRKYNDFLCSFNLFTE